MWSLFGVSTDHHGGTELTWLENPTWERHVIVKDVPRTINLDVYDYDGCGIPEIAMGHNFETMPEKSIGVRTSRRTCPERRAHAGWRAARPARLADAGSGQLSQTLLRGTSFWLTAARACLPAW
jgi:hypothetical protein